MIHITMDSSSLSSPLAEETESMPPRKDTRTSQKTKVLTSAPKRPCVRPGVVEPHNPGPNGRGRRTRAACERCRMKKVKRDSGSPCQRCRDDGLICIARAYKKTEHKQLARECANVLGNTQLALITTVHKLYNMVRNSQSWELGEPDLDGCGLPVLHDIALKLGCIRPNSDINLCEYSAAPGYEAGVAHQPEHEDPKDDDGQKYTEDTICYNYQQDGCVSSPTLGQLGAKDYLDNALPLSPQSFVGCEDYDLSSINSKMTPGFTFTSQMQSMLGSSTRITPKPPSPGLALCSARQEALHNISMKCQDTTNPEYSTTWLDIPLYPHSDALVGINDPMICGDFDNKSVVF